MFKRSFQTITIFAFISFLLSLPCMAQHQKTKTMSFNKGEVTIIQGLGAILINGENNLVVEMMMPKENLPKEYKNVDLKKQDQIIMCNGKRVKTIEDLDGIIDKLDIGDTIEFGIKRDKEMMIVTFPKAEGQAGGGTVMVQTTTIDNTGGGESNILNINGKEIIDAVFIVSGLVVHEEGGILKVATVLPTLKDNITGDIPSDGDVIVAMNGTTYNSSNDFRNAYHSIQEGESIELSLKNGDKAYSISFKKQKMKMDNEVTIEK